MSRKVLTRWVPGGLNHLKPGLGRSPHQFPVVPRHVMLHLARLSVNIIAWTSSRLTFLASVLPVKNRQIVLYCFSSGKIM
jgi:hypothetical protein